MAIKVDSFESGGGGRRIGGTLAEINIIPLVDVTLVLLLIFMLTAPLMYRGVDVNLPLETKSANQQVDPNQIVLDITADRTITVNKQVIALTALQDFLRTTFEARKEKTMFIIGDPTLRYAEVVAVIDAAKGAGVDKVGIVTEGMRKGDSSN